MRANTTDSLPAEIQHVRALRRAIEEQLEAMLTLLDQLDGDCDIEDGGDTEPYLASVGQSWSSNDISDREIEDENDEDGHDQEDDRSDLEPSLGWSRLEAETGAYATGWHVNQDLEDEHDGCEPETDSSVDDYPCDESDGASEGGEPWHWRNKQREAARGRCTKSVSNVSPIIAGPFRDLYQVVSFGGQVNG